jgi:hydroxymethylpyrimidine pyrophosphatase-like HAD family hydrolase
VDHLTPALLATDLDGTLLNSQRRASEADVATLHELGGRGIARAVVTGRSLHSTLRILAADFPIDYLVFSSGAGIWDWPHRRLLTSHEIPAEQTIRAAQVLIGQGANFMVHAPVPENHRFWYHETKPEDTDFVRRRDHDPSLGVPLADAAGLGAASQLLAVLPANLDRYMAIRDALVGLEVIRTTSPMDGRSIWLEVFPKGVSKASGCAWLAESLGLSHEHVFALGNDYNDLHMLEWAHRAAVVANAPLELRRRFPVVASNDENGLTEACRSWGLA